MFIKPSQNRRRGWTLIESVVASGVFSLAAMALMSMFVFSLRSMEAIGNYAELDKQNRLAMDRLTREIRQARQVTGFTSNSLTIEDGDGNTVNYTFNGDMKQLVRTSSNEGSKVLLKDCHLLSFGLFQRNPIGGSYDIYPVATGNWAKTVKVVQLTWKTSRKLSGTPVVNTDNVQTARIVIRKQQD